MQSLSLSATSISLHGRVSDHTFRQQFSIGSDERAGRWNAARTASDVTANATNGIVRTALCAAAVDRRRRRRRRRLLCTGYEGSSPCECASLYALPKNGAG